MNNIIPFVPLPHDAVVQYTDEHYNEYNLIIHVLLVAFSFNLEQPPLGFGERSPIDQIAIVPTIDVSLMMNCKSSLETKKSGVMTDRLVFSFSYPPTPGYPVLYKICFPLFMEPLWRSVELNEALWRLHGGSVELHGSNEAK